VTKLISEVICFLLGIDPSQSSDRDLMEVEDHGKTDRERQKLIREQNILKQVCVFCCCFGFGLLLFAFCVCVCGGGYGIKEILQKIFRLCIIFYAFDNVCV